MRILIVTQYFWPENFRINDLVAELVQRGHKVTVLTGYPNYPSGTVFPEFRKDPKKYSEFVGAEVLRVPVVSRRKGGLFLLLNYATFAISASVVGSWKLRDRIVDTIFVYEPSPITVGLPAALFRATKKAPLAFWVLDLWPETLRAIGVVRSMFLLKVVGKLVSFVYNRCDLILAQSKSFIPQIAQYCNGAQRILYFPSWAEAVFDLERVTLATEVSVQAGVFTIMFAGNIGDAQDFPTILRAAEILRPREDIRWLIVGDGRAAGWVAEEISRRNLSGRVQMLGRHPVESMPSFYKHADALLVTLKDEPVFSMTIPGKLQSYLAAGLPVVAMLNGEGADLVRRSRSGVVCNAGDADALTQIVLELVSMTTAQRLEMGSNGRAIVRTEFDRNTLITRLEKWLSDLAAGAPVDASDQR